MNKWGFFLIYTVKLSFREALAIYTLFSSDLPILGIDIKYTTMFRRKFKPPLISSPRDPLIYVLTYLKCEFLIILIYFYYLCD